MIDKRDGEGLASFTVRETVFPSADADIERTVEWDGTFSARNHFIWSP